MSDQYTMTDLVTQYPKLDMPSYQQDEPVLDTKLKPKVNHSESSYIGQGSLNECKTVYNRC